MAKKQLRAKKTGSGGAIWWLVDPFNDKPEFHKRALGLLTTLAKSLKCGISPLCYLDTYRALEKQGARFPLFPYVRDSFEMLSSDMITRFRLMIPAKLRAGLSNLQVVTHKPEHVPSLRDKVEACEREARQGGAIALALHTHARRGLQRLFMGSFAETFLLYGRLPALFINPHCREFSKVKRIIFPTDFSRESKVAFDTALHFANRLNAKLSIVHCLPVITSYPVFLSKQSRQRYAAHLAKQEKRAVQTGRQWLKRAQTAGVSAAFVPVKDPEGLDPSAAVLKLAKKEKAELIALAARSGPLQSGLVGATSREIVRAAECPVLIHRG